MKKFFNTSFQNESILFKELLPIWKTYDIDQFLFFDDHSTDNGAEIALSILGKDRCKIFNKPDLEYDDSHCVGRQMMLDYSREHGADYVFCLDADELLSSNLASDMNYILQEYDHTNIHMYWYNIVNYSLSNTRCDGHYKSCYHQFVIPLKHSGNFSFSSKQHHSFWRTPPINLQNNVATKDIGIVHLQMINTKYYVYKQLWYKHYEHNKYGFDEEYINNRYDKNINFLNFEIFTTPEKIIKDISFDYSVFDKIIDLKNYRSYINRYYNEKLVTFGKEYLV